MYIHIYIYIYYLKTSERIEEAKKILRAKKDKLRKEADYLEMNAARSSTFNIMFDDKPLERTSPEHLSPEHQQIIPSVQPIYPTTNLAIEPASAPSSQKGDTGNKEKGSHRKEYNKDIGDIIDTEEYIVNREDSSERPISTPSEDAYKGDLGGVQSADRENEQFAAFMKNLEKAKYECEGMNVQGQGTQNIQKINITKEKY